MTVHPIDTEALRRLADAATDGPWEAIGTGVRGGDHWYVCADSEAIASVSAQDGSNEDERQPLAEFIAVARTAVPALLDLLAAAEHRATRAEARIKAVREPHQPDGHDPDVCGEPDCFVSCIEDGMEWPCDTIRALDGTVTPRDA